MSRCVLVCCLWTAGWAVAGDSKPDAERLFAVKVWPLLQDKCGGCHGQGNDGIKGEFDVTSLEACVRGGESGDPGLIPGSAADSVIYQAVRWDGYEMPPKENDRLTPEQCELVRRWIDAGAPWPDEERRAVILAEERERPVTEDGLLIETSGGLSDEWTYRRYDPADVWAFRPVRKPAVPAGAGSPVDAFVNAKLAKVGVEPALTATPRELIRRVTFDLTGLPPTPAEVKDFLAVSESDADAAYESLVDRLLASPHYGERQAQHWLDVARYADTGGMSNDYERSNAWRYRDWVIRAFNDDLPYDDFVKAQIAGDEIAAALAPRADDGVGIGDEGEEAAASDLSSPIPNPSSLRVATGFLRMGPWDTAMIPAEESRQIFLDDVTHSVGQAFLSMPLRCCKCHDHKFDPVPTRDYYRIYATFAAAQPAEMPADFTDAELTDGFEEERAFLEGMLSFADAEAKRLQNKREDAARAWYEERGLEYKHWNARKDDPDDQKPERHVGLTEEEQGVLKVREQDVWIWTRRLERVEPMVQSVYNGSDRKWVNAKKLRQPDKDNADWRPDSRIFAGGSYQAPLDEVGPGVLSATGVPASDGDDPYRVTDELDGRRLALADWIADPDNPLTARSFVNRVWQSHFGRGLVKTPNNFGVKGDKPTHPRLLDWLAADFVEHGWQVKRLHKRIVMSDAYRRSTKHPSPDALAEADPSGDLYAAFVPRRLTAEELRDAMLSASGELNPQMGGLPVRPEINMEVALQPRMIQFSLAPAYQPSPTPGQRNRRSIYTYRVRGQADPMLEVLNLPNPNDSCELRDAAAVTPQAFTLLNSDATTDRAVALALRLSDERDTTEARIRRAFELVLNRPATDTEVSRLAEYAAEMTAFHEANPPEPVTYPTSITRSLVEELSGRPFEYEERLPAFEEYVPDKKPADVDAATRALADACLVLLNANEFVYVY